MKFSSCLIAAVVLPTASLAADRDLGLTAGEGVAFALESRVLGERREIRVSLPDDYQKTDDRYPVLYVLDADWHFLPAVAAVRMLSETSYIQSHRIPKLIVVGIVSVDRNEDSTPTHRVDQHGMSFPTSGGADAFLSFLEEELVPSIDSRFRTHPHRILAGWSLGGLFTMHALFEQPDVFAGYLAISPSLWWDDSRLLERASDLAARGVARDRDLVITVGTDEDGGLCHTAIHDLVRRWSDTPLPELRVDLVEIPGEDHNHSPFKAYFDGIRSLFASWFFPEEAFAGGLPALDAHYALLSERYGHAVEIPEHIYLALTRSLLADNRPGEAVAIAETRCTRQPDSADARFQLGETHRRAHDPASARRAYLEAIDIEMRRAEPDTIFIGYLEHTIDGLEGS